MAVGRHPSRWPVKATKSMNGSTGESLKRKIPIRRGREVASLPLAAPTSARRSSFRACIGSSRACRGDPLFWTADSLLRHTVYVRLREDKATDQVRREAPATGRPSSGGGLEERMAETHKPNTLARVEIRGAPPYILIQRGPRRPSKRRPAHTGEKATRFPLPRSHPLRAKSPAQIPLGRRHLGDPHRSRESLDGRSRPPVNKIYGRPRKSLAPKGGWVNPVWSSAVADVLPTLHAKSVAPRVAAAHRTRASYR
jgi:hypothetical protein